MSTVQRMNVFPQNRNFWLRQFNSRSLESESSCQQLFSHLTDQTSRSLDRKMSSCMWDRVAQAWGDTSELYFFSRQKSHMQAGGNVGSSHGKNSFWSCMTSVDMKGWHEGSSEGTERNRPAGMRRQRSRLCRELASDRTVSYIPEWAEGFNLEFILSYDG